MRPVGVCEPYFHLILSRVSCNIMRKCMQFLQKERQTYVCFNFVKFNPYSLTYQLHYSVFRGQKWIILWGALFLLVVAVPVLLVRLVHFVLEIHTMFMSTLVIFSPTFPRWSVKVSLLPSNTLSGTIWSWMMNIACMTTGKSISLQPFCPQSSNKGNHRNLIWAMCLRLGAPSDKIQHVSHLHWGRAKWN